MLSKSGWWDVPQNGPSTVNSGSLAYSCECCRDFQIQSLGEFGAETCVGHWVWNCRVILSRGGWDNMWSETGTCRWCYWLHLKFSHYFISWVGQACGCIYFCSVYTQLINCVCIFKMETQGFCVLGFPTHSCFHIQFMPEFGTFCNDIFRTIEKVCKPFLRGKSTRFEFWVSLTRHRYLTSQTLSFLICKMGTKARRVVLRNKYNCSVHPLAYDTHTKDANSSRLVLSEKEVWRDEELGPWLQAARGSNPGSASE